MERLTNAGTRSRPRLTPRARIPSKTRVEWSSGADGWSVRRGGGLAGLARHGRSERKPCASAFDARDLEQIKRVWRIQTGEFPGRVATRLGLQLGLGIRPHRQITSPGLTGAHVRRHDRAERRFLDAKGMCSGVRDKIPDDFPGFILLPFPPQDLRTKAQEGKSVVEIGDVRVQGFEVIRRR